MRIEARPARVGPRLRHTPRVTPRTGRPFLDDVLEQPGSVLALAHRGGAGHPDLVGLENTLTAFRHASALGYRYLETDVHLSADGVLVAFHDQALDRVTDRTGELERLRADQIAAARIGEHDHVPSLSALFDELPHARFNIDLKSEGAGPALADFIAARAAWDRVLVGAFALPRLRDFRRRTAGRVATAASPVEVAAFLAARTRRLAARVARHFDAVQVPRSRGRLPVTTPSLVRRAHQVQAHVHVWTVDEPADIAQLLDLGVDGLFTDRTDTLKAVLVEQGRWRGDSR